MKTSFQAIACNKAGAVRHDRMGGREYLVVPMVMIVEGVLNGSSGPILYPEDELAKFPVAWNHKPVVVYHPELNGQPLSACDPDILTVQGTGLIMNSSYEPRKGEQPGKLRAEAWLDPVRINEVDERVAEAVQKNTVLELSTGLHIDVEPTEGEFNGKKYTGIARNFKPDHLAILPDKVGACSVEDGAGFLRANEEWSTADVNDLPDSCFLYIEAGGKKDEGSKTTPRSLRHLPYKGMDGKVDLPHLRNALARVPQMEGLSDSKKAALTARAQQILRRSKNGMMTNAADEVSYGALRDGLQALLVEGWVMEVFPSTFVYEIKGTLYQQEYRQNTDGTVTLTGTPVQVIRRINYVEANGQRFIGSVAYAEETIMSKNEMVDHLIKSGKWSETDKVFLSHQTDDNLKHLVDKADKATADEAKKVPEKEPEKVPAANSETAKAKEPAKPQTAEEYIASAPSGIQDVLNQGLRTYNTSKAGLVKKIMANKRNTFTEVQLNAKALDELEGLVKLAGEDMAAAPTANYAGQGEVADNGGKEVEPLPLPTFNFAKAGK